MATKGEIIEELPLGAVTFAQYQSRVAKAFLNLEWKITSVDDTRIVANIPNFSAKDKLDSVALELEGGKCVIKYTPAVPNAFFPEKTTKKTLQTPFKKQFDKETPDVDTDDKARHQVEMTNVLSEQNRRAEEKKAKAEARKRKWDTIKLCVFGVLDLAVFIFGWCAWGSATSGLIALGVCQLLLWIVCKIVWPIFWKVTDFV